MKNSETGAPHTAHTTNVVPFIMSGDGKQAKTSGGDGDKLKFAEEEESGKMGYVIGNSAAEKVEEKEEERAEAKKEGKEVERTKEEEEEEEESGALCDVAPTILDVMGIEKPEEMGGRSLLAH